MLNSYIPGWIYLIFFFHLTRLTIQNTHTHKSFVIWLNSIIPWISCIKFKGRDNNTPQVRSISWWCYEFSNLKYNPFYNWMLTSKFSYICFISFFIFYLINTPAVFMQCSFVSIISFFIFISLCLTAQSTSYYIYTRIDISIFTVS